MDETLWGEVGKKFEDTLGKVSSAKKAMSQLADYNRYIMYAVFEKWGFECLLGYWLPNENPADPVWVGADLGVNPKTQIGKRAISAFRSYSKKSTGWDPNDLNEESEWGWISKRKTLQEFMNQSDHIKAIKAYLLGLLKEVEGFKKAHPELPWNSQDAGVDEE